MKTTFADRLRESRKKKGLTQKELGKLVGVSQAAIQKLEKGIASSSSYTSQIADVLGVSSIWLATGEERGSETIPDERQWSKVSPWDSRTPIEDDEVEVSFLKDIEFACGNGSCSEEDHNGFKLRFSKATLRKIGANSDGSGVVCFPAKGNSMEPFIPDGATVAINIMDKKIVDGKVYAINQNGWKRLKVLYQIGPNTLSIRSFNNEEHKPEEASLTEIEIIGRMFWSATVW